MGSGPARPTAPRRVRRPAASGCRRARCRRRCAGPVGVAPGATSMRGATTGALPVSIHVESARSAALATTCVGPLLMGTPQSMDCDARADEVRVGVRGAGDLPEPEVIGVGLARRVRVEDARDVGLGLDVEHGRVLVGAEDRRCPAERSRDVGGRVRRDDGHARRAPAVHEEAVEGVRERLHAVEVRDERERRLRFARRDQRCGGRTPPRPAPLRSARATWVKMSNEYPSPGCSSVP